MKGPPPSGPAQAEVDTHVADIAAYGAQPYSLLDPPRACLVEKRTKRTVCRTRKQWEQIARRIEQGRTRK